MIERHYFKDKLIKSFDFDFGYCMPNSVNTCEHIYELPNLSKENSKLFLRIICDIKPITFEHTALLYHLLDNKKYPIFDRLVY